MATTPDAELHEQYEQAEDEARGAQLVQATIADRVDDVITAKLREWMHGNDIIV